MKLFAWLALLAGAGATAAVIATTHSSKPATPPPAPPPPASFTPPPAPPPSSPLPAPPPSSPTSPIPAPSVAAGQASSTISWAGAGRGALGFTVDLDDDGDFSNGFWHKDVSPTSTSTAAPAGFQPYNGASGALNLKPGATYWVRVFYPHTGDESPTTTFTVPKLTGVIGFTLGFAVRGRDSYWEQIPSFANYDARDSAWWDATVDDAVRAGVDFVAPVTRGCNPNGPPDIGNGSPRELDKLAASLARFPVTANPKVALFVDSGDAFLLHKNLTKHGVDSRTPAFDWADQDGTGEGGWNYFWDLDVKIFYETIPRERLYLYDGRPLIYFWSVSPGLGYTNHKGNTSRFLRYLRQNVRNQLGLDPFIVVDRSWIDNDPTITTSDADGVHDWFDPTVAAYTVRSWNGRKFAVSVPGFKDNIYSSLHRELPRRAGATLRDALSAITTAGTNLTLLEGLTDVEESAGYYRSDDPAWAGDPNRYLDVVRAFAQ